MGVAVGSGVGMGCLVGEAVGNGVGVGRLVGEAVGSGVTVGCLVGEEMAVEGRGLAVELEGRVGASPSW